MKITLNRVAAVCVAVLIIVFVGCQLVGNENSKPMARQLEADGYTQTEIISTGCQDATGFSYKCGPNGNKPVDFDSEDIRQATYRPAGAPDHCDYVFYYTDPELFSQSGWRYELRWDVPSQTTLPLGATSFKQTNNLQGVVIIERPTPEQLWTFVNEHLNGVDPACKPTDA